VVVFESMTGGRFFEGASVSDTLAAVLKEEPRWEVIPQQLQPLLRACLVRDARRRIRDIGDARLLLDEPAAEAPASAPRRTWLPWTVAALALTLLCAGGVWL